MATIIINNAFTADILREEGLTSSLEEIMQPIEAADRLNGVSVRLKKEAYSSWKEFYALEDEGMRLIRIIGHDNGHACKEAVSAFEEVMWDIDSRYESRDW